MFIIIHLEHLLGVRAKKDLSRVRTKEHLLGPPPGLSWRGAPNLAPFVPSGVSRHAAVPWNMFFGANARKVFFGASIHKMF